MTGSLMRWHGPDAGRCCRDEARAAQLGVQLRTVVQDFQNKQAEHARWVERITRKLHEEADQRGYCSEFDDVMEECGLARRTRPFQVTMSVTVELVWDGQARDEDDAEGLASEDFDVSEGQTVMVGQHRGSVTDIEATVEEQ